MKSKNYKGWFSVDDPRRCEPCEDYHGKIYAMNEKPNPKPPLHFFCRCIIKALEAVKAGSATKLGTNGADFWIKYFKKLPEYYISKYDAKKLGWVQQLGNLANVAPGKMIFGGVYQNRNGHLPMAEGRIWYEADIDYTFGWRGDRRGLFSNDGLIFVSYDHYETFEEIV